MTTAEKQQRLVAIYAKLELDISSLPLGSLATDIVPGEGNPDAELLFIGEAPGYYEAVQRRPFVGKSGQLFRQVLHKAGWEDDQVYISNIVKVRPPDNRDPLPAEITAFRPYLDEEILTINPLLIVTLGRYSMAKFLPDVKVSQVHGRLHKIRWKGRTWFVLPMYHPAAALRSAQVEASFEADFGTLPKILEWIRTQQKELAFQSEVAEALL